MACAARWRPSATTATIGVYGRKFVDGMVGRGYDPEFAQRCFKQIEGFGSYGFPESHAVSFAKLVYVSAWIKHHYPDVFCAALLNSQPMGFYQPAQLVRDAREHGVETRAARRAAQRLGLHAGECLLPTALRGGEPGPDHGALPHSAWSAAGAGAEADGGRGLGNGRGWPDIARWRPWPCASNISQRGLECLAEADALPLDGHGPARGPVGGQGPGRRDPHLSSMRRCWPTPASPRRRCSCR